MARKKRPPGDEGRPKHRKPSRDLPPELPDRRLMEAGMRDLLAGLQGGTPDDTPLNRAQDLEVKIPKESRSWPVRQGLRTELCPDNRQNDRNRSSDLSLLAVPHSGNLKAKL